MARIDGDPVELTDADAALAKGMVQRGDHQHNIAAWFGVDSRAISHLANGQTFAQVPAAPVEVLPPPGPYRMDPYFVELYRRIVKIDCLWNERRMKDAKALLEACVRSPAMVPDRTDIEAEADDLLRDEFGLLI